MLGSENKTGIVLVLIVLIKKIDNEYVITRSVRCNIWGVHSSEIRFIRDKIHLAYKSNSIDN